MKTIAFLTVAMAISFAVQAGKGSCEGAAMGNLLLDLKRFVDLRSGPRVTIYSFE